MAGYLNNPQATAATVDADRWLHTADLGYMDADGHLYVADRLKELIKYKGFQVPPAELEAVLLRHPDVADAAVLYPPIAPRSPAGPLQPGPGWWNRARSGSRSAEPRTSCPCRGRSCCAGQNGSWAPIASSIPRRRSGLSSACP